MGLYAILIKGEVKSCPISDLKRVQICYLVSGRLFAQTEVEGNTMNSNEGILLR
jgi:hypothetical protein